MASLVLGAVGAVVGGFFGAPQLGWAIGSAIGGAYAASQGQHTTVEGQKLRDLKIQDSAYGNFIPILYGIGRVAGNVIWSTDKIPVRHEQTESAGGKGGGGSSQTTVTWTCKISCAISLGVGPIVGIRRVWAYGSLIYDASSGSAVIGSLPMEVHLGTENQLPDPTIQGYVGAANTPAYRGQAYVVFTDLDLSLYNNDLPSFTFEYLAAGTPADSTRLITTYVSSSYILSSNNPIAITPDGSLYGTVNVASGGPLPAGTYLSGISKTDGSMISPYPASSSAGIVGVCSDGRLWVNGLTTASLSTHEQLFLVTPGAQWSARNGINHYSNLGFQAKSGRHHAPIGTGLWAINTLHLNGVGDVVHHISADTMVVIGEVSSWPGTTDGLDTIVSLATDGTYVYAVGLLNIYRIDTSTQSVDTYGGGADSGRLNATFYNGYLWVTSSSTQHVTLYNPDLTTFTSLSGGSYSGANDFVPLENGNMLLTHTGVAVGTELDASGNLITLSYLPSSSGFYSGARNPSTDETYVYAAGVAKLYQVYSGRLASSQVALSTIVADILSRCGFAPSDYDVSALSTTMVDGFYITSQAPARQWIEQLATAYFFDAVEHNGVLAFVKRGGASAITIPDDDLAAHEPSKDVPPLLQEERMQETELSKSLAVTYYNLNGDYLQTTQEAKRLNTRSLNQTNTTLSLALSNDHARQIADIQLYNEHLARTTYVFTVGPKYSIYEPTDVITIDGKTMRIVSDNRDDVLAIQFTAVAEDSSVYTNTSTGAAANFPSQVVNTIPYTNLLLLDIPQLRDPDTDSGFYTAAYSSGSWGGAVVYKSADGGVTYSSMLQLFAPMATVGNATSALGDWTGPNIPDEKNSFSVSLYSGSLSSITFAQMLLGQNTALLGSEIIVFRLAPQNSDGTYTCSGLLRGCFGTERNTGTHVAGETFILLTSATINNFVDNNADLNVSFLYKGVTIGGNMLIAPPTTFTNTGVRLKPYTCVQLSVGRNAALDCLINWNRRARYGGAWRDAVDVPLCETVESYDVEIYSDNTYTTLKRTFSATGASPLTYTAAQQTTDFGSTQSTIYFKVYQNSSVVGRGFAATGSG